MEIQTKTQSDNMNQINVAFMTIILMLGCAIFFYEFKVSDYNYYTQRDIFNPYYQYLLGFIGGFVAACILFIGYLGFTLKRKIKNT